MKTMAEIASANISERINFIAGALLRLERANKPTKKQIKRVKIASKNIAILRFFIII